MNLVKFIRLILLLCPVSLWADAYLLVYITKDGYSGHAGLAIDNYQTIVIDTTINGMLQHRYDTVPDGTLTYFDMYPTEEVSSVADAQRDVAANYFQYPVERMGKRLYTNMILYQGVPGRNPHRADGIIRLRTTPSEGIRLKYTAASLAEKQRPYNGWHYNCSDYVNAILKIKYPRLKAKEQVLHARFTTPNKLFRRMARCTGCEVVITPGRKALKRSFFKEKFLYGLFHKKTPEPVKPIA